MNRDRGQPSVAYLLGAGFSKSVAPVMPLMPELGAEVLDALELPLSTLGPFENNIEIWLSYLATPQPWLTEAEVLSNRSTFLQVSAAIYDSIGSSEAAALSEPIPVAGARLVWHMSRNQSHVITLNYDRIVESMALSLGAGKTSAELYSAPLTERARPGSGGVFGPGQSRFPTLTLHKLHGSVNWFARSIEQLAQSDVFVSAVWDRWGSRPWTNELPAQLADLTPFIIPPVASKSDFYASSVLRSEWRASAKALSTAEELVVIGYSFPQSDSQLRTFVARNLSPEAHVTVVDRNAAVAETLDVLLPNPVNHAATSVEKYAEIVSPDCVEWSYGDWIAEDSEGTVSINGNPRPHTRAKLLELLKSGDSSGYVEGHGSEESDRDTRLLDGSLFQVSPWSRDSIVAFVPRAVDSAGVE